MPVLPAERETHLETPRYGRSPLRVAIAVPLAALCLYAVAIAARGVDLSNAAFAYADAPGGAYLGAAVLAGPTRLPLHSELVTSLLEAAFLHLPLAHALIQLLGPTLMLAAVGVACIAVHRLRRQWLLTAVTGLALGPIPLWSALFPTAHVLTLACIAVLGLSAVALAGGGLSRRWALATGVLCGATLLSDQSLLVEGVLPFLVVVGGMRVRLRSREAVASAGLIVGSAFAVAALGFAAMTAAGIHIVFELTPGASAANTLASSTNTVVHTFSAMISGRWYGADLAPPLGIATALLALVIPLTAPLALLRERRAPARDAARLAYLGFWTTVDVVIIVSFVAYGYGGAPVEGHYLIPCLFSAVATFPLLLGPRHVRAAAIFASAFVAVQAAGLLTLPPQSFALGSDPAEAARVLTAIRDQDLTSGYAGYWLSHPITWLSGETVHVYPVQQSACDGGRAVCPYEFSGDSWYAPRSAATFLVVSASDRCVATVPATLGTPVRRVQVDAGTTLYIFDHDIAAAFARTPLEAC